MNELIHGSNLKLNFLIEHLGMGIMMVSLAGNVGHMSLRNVMLLTFWPKFSVLLGLRQHNKKLWDNLGIIAIQGVTVRGHLGAMSPTNLGNVLHNVAYKFYGSYVEIPQELCDQEHKKRIVGQRHPMPF
jgi:hypothetical protein